MQAIQFNGGNQVTIQGLSIVNSPSFHLTFTSSKSIQILSVKINAPGTSIHTDRIDINGHSTDFRIISCNIGTGDDCVSIGSGSSNIYIEDLKCGPGHGISVGSLGKRNTQAQVSNVHVNGATLTAITSGLRIKTLEERIGRAELEERIAAGRRISDLRRLVKN
ncbi:hypothetical protein SUGI_0122270 [Cryptomeria japonica]|nr:hypothetical protein SUGI_0122270 [Cryptomeria japonica]